MRYVSLLLRVAPTSPISDHSMLDYCAAGARAGAGGDVTPQDARLGNRWDSFYRSDGLEERLKRLIKI